MLNEISHRSSSLSDKIIDWLQKLCINPVEHFLPVFTQIVGVCSTQLSNYSTWIYGYLTRSNVYGYYSASSGKISTNYQLWWSFNVALQNELLLLFRCSTVVETGLEAFYIQIHLDNHHNSLIRSLSGLQKIHIINLMLNYSSLIYLSLRLRCI